jgi:outer membrane lipoprotein
MRTHLKVQLLVLGTLVATLTGCVSYPVSEPLRKAARPVTPGQVSQDPEAYKGAIVIWGGRIINTVNDTNGGAIYVLDLPLTSDERPEANAVGRGRFLVRTGGFADPEVYRRGTLVTVAGEVTGTESEPLQTTRYTYPVISLREIHFWHVVRREYYYYYYPGWGPYYPYPGWYWGYGPGWGGGWGYYYSYPDWDWDRNHPGHRNRY